MDDPSRAPPGPTTARLGNRCLVGEQPGHQALAGVRAGENRDLPVRDLERDQCAAVAVHRALETILVALARSELGVEFDPLALKLPDSALPGFVILDLAEGLGVTLARSLHREGEELHRRGA